MQVIENTQNTVEYIINFPHTDTKRVKQGVTTTH